MPPHFSVSIKGVVLINRCVLLLKNERDEWELPGGRLEAGEDPVACVVREIREELSIDVCAGGIIDCWLYHVLPGREVVIVTYGCLVRGESNFVKSDEHNDVALFALDDIDRLPMPEGYRRSIRLWSSR